MGLTVGGLLVYHRLYQRNEYFLWTFYLNDINFCIVIICTQSHIRKTLHSIHYKINVYIITLGMSNKRMEVTTDSILISLHGL